MNTREDFRKHFTRMAEDPKSHGWQKRFALEALRNLGGRHEAKPPVPPPPMVRVPLPEEMPLGIAMDDLEREFADMANP